MRTENAIMLAKHREAVVLQALESADARGRIPWDAVARATGQSRASVIRWVKRYKADGLAGLLDRCTNSGRKSAADKLRLALGDAEFNRLVKEVQGRNYDYKSNSLAWRKTALDESAPAPVRELFARIMQKHSSKHSIPRSLRQLTDVNPAQRLLHQGRRAFKLSGVYINRRPDIIPGDVYVSDDETDIVYCAVKTAVCEKYPHGYKLMQVQCFPMLDVASQYVGSFAMVARERGSYRATDLWAFFGHAIRDMKLPRIGFQFERGTWESNIIRGVKVDYDPEEPTARQRIGGLEMLPNRILPWHREHAGADLSILGTTLKIFTSYLPKSKSVEGWFNRSQRLRQAIWGYAGRDQRKTPQEKILKLAGACQRGTENPAEHFMLMEELYDAYGRSIQELNQDRMEGEVFSGVPQQVWEEWTTKAGCEQLDMHPASAWMYKNMWAQGVVKGPFIRARLTDELTRARYTEVWSSATDLHAYDGKTVLVYWDRDDIDSPAVIIDGRTGDFLCEAEHFDKPGMFLDDDMTGLRIVKEWERFNCTLYGNVKKFIPSLRKPEGVRQRQAETRREERRVAADFTATTDVTVTAPEPASTDDWSHPLHANRPKIRTREQMLMGVA